MDNRPVEKLGEKYIQTRLIKHGFDTHSELSFDREGADLIITQIVDKKTLHYIKIQSKSRKINKSTKVLIPKNYIQENFVLFVYLLDKNGEEFLLCFFEEDFSIFIENKQDLILNISYSKLQTKLKEFTFNDHKAEKLKKLFEKFKKKNYTSIIIDGIFLKESIIETNKIYTKIWKRDLIKPKLNEIIKNIILKYNSFENNENDIACYLYISNHHDLETSLEINNRENNFYINEKNPVKIFTIYSNDLVNPQIIDDINRFKNSNNIILVANDIIYENFLLNLKNEVDDLIIMRLKIVERLHEMYVNYKWGDISYPIALSMGIKPHEL